MLPMAAGSAAMLLLACMMPAQGFAADQTALVQKGQSLFQQNCSSCHGIGDGDRPTGPDLSGVTTRQSRGWLERFIRAPDKVIAAGDPTATKLLAKFHLPMPNLGLSQDQVTALIAYLSTTGEATRPQTSPKTKAAAPAPPPSASTAVPSAPTGDPAVGERLFVGTRPMENGGAPCLGCHGIAGHGLGGGASFGPDLTTLYSNYGSSGVASVLSTLPFPTMQPIFAKRPLTPDEQADLVAFFKKVSGEPPLRIGGHLSRDVILALLILAGILFLFGRQRLLGVRRELLAKASKPEGGTK